MSTRHSKQIPIPHNGPRGSPVTEFRQCIPATVTAMATVAPRATETLRPFTIRVICSGMQVLHAPDAGGQIRLDRDLGRPSRNLCDQQPRGCERSCNTQTFMPGG